MVFANNIGKFINLLIFIIKLLNKVFFVLKEIIEFNTMSLKSAN